MSIGLVNAARKYGVMDPSTLPYTKADSLLTVGEQEFHQVLRRVVGDRWSIYLKVRLEDIAGVPEHAPNRPAHRNRVKSHHIDFLLCTTNTASPLLAIELDDSSHRYSNAQRRDAQKDAILASVGLPLLRVQWQPSYDEHWLERAINDRISGFVPPVAADAPSPPPYSPPRPTYTPTLARYSPPRSTYSYPREYERSRSRTPRRRRSPRGRFELIKASFLLVAAIVLLYGAFTGGLNDLARAGLSSLVPERSATLTPAEVSLSPVNEFAPGSDLPSNIATVDTASLNLRSGPGTNHPSLGSYPRNTQLEALGKDPTSAWLQVRHPTGTTGWMSVRFLKLSTPLDNVPVVTSP